MAAKSLNKFNVKRPILVVAVITLLLGAGLYLYKVQKKEKISSFAGCVADGRPVMESYPEQCSADGKTYANPDQKVNTDSNSQPENNNNKSSTTSSLFFEISEWRVRGPSTNTVTLEYTPRDSSMMFTSEELTAADSKCADSGGSITRRQPNEVFDPSLSNQTVQDFLKSVDSSKYKKLGDYYFIFTSPGGACSENTKALELMGQTVNQVMALMQGLESY